MPWDTEPDTIMVPGSARFPIELSVPPGFDPEDSATWPRVEGGLEWVAGRLLYMPPCGLSQQVVAVSVGGVLWTWARSHRDFVVGGNEAGMVLEGDVRGADAVVFRRETVDTSERRYARIPPILAVEVEGREEGEVELRTKAAWYLERGVLVVWLVLDTTRDVVVIQPDRESRVAVGERLPPHPALPELEPDVADFFDQLD
jgi:Uma2 family endonuclease